MNFAHECRLPVQAERDTALTPVQIERWRRFLHKGNVGPDLAQGQLEEVVKQGLVLGRLTPAQKSLPTREYIGRGLECLVIKPGKSSSAVPEFDKALQLKTIELVRATFPYDESIPLKKQPTATWTEFVKDVMARRNYFIESDPGMEGLVGVNDAMFVYFARKDSTQPLLPEEFGEAQLVAIHGLYHYIVKPTVYWGIRFAVDPELQGKGIGRKIMSHNLEQCLRLGAERRQLFTEKDPVHNGRILNMYRHWGFTETGQTLDYNGKEQICLSASLEEGSQAWKMAKSFADDSGDPVL